MRRIAMKAPLIVVLAAGALALSGCSSNAPTGPDYDFSTSTFGPSEKVIFSVPDEVLELDPEYAENRFVDSITATPLTLESDTLCGIELAFEFIGDPVQALASTMSGSDTPSEEDVSAALDIVVGANNVADPDLTAPEPGSYVSEDLSTVTIVLDCGESIEGGGATTGISLDAQVGDGSPFEMAVADLGVTDGGDLYVTSGSVLYWDVDDEGNWSEPSN